jgi:hypothetical protein
MYLYVTAVVVVVVVDAATGEWHDKSFLQRKNCDGIYFYTTAIMMEI